MWLDVIDVLILLACGLTPAATLVLGAVMMWRTRRSEALVHVLLSSTFSVSLLAALGAACAMLTSGTTERVLDLGPLVALGSYHLELSLLIDPMSVMMLCVNFLLCGLVAYFSSKYLHRDEGYFRFFMMLLWLAMGVELVVMAAGFDLMFIGWEMLGMSSALLIAFFFRRQAPVDHGLWAYGIYRVTDIGLLSAIILLHHVSGDMALLGELGVGTEHAVLIGALFIWGAMGKGAIFPLTGWLPRAMEGPTTSSAIFYGALSVHVSPYLLWRIAPLLEAHVGLRLAAGVLGVLTMVHASMVGRVQTDAKSAMAYASAAQVGAMWLWIALGWYELAMVHMASHAVGRAWQILRAPSFIHERRELERLLGRAMDPSAHVESLLPVRVERWLYHVAMQRWFIDEFFLRVIGLASRILLAVDRADVYFFGLVAADYDEIEIEQGIEDEERVSSPLMHRGGSR